MDGTFRVKRNEVIMRFANGCTIHITRYHSVRDISVMAFAPGGFQIYKGQHIEDALMEVYNEVAGNLKATI